MALLVSNLSLPKSCNFTTTGVQNATDARCNDIHGLLVGGRDVRNSSNSFALQWWVFSSVVEKLKWFSFNLALMFALYT